MFNKLNFNNELMKAMRFTTRMQYKRSLKIAIILIFCALVALLLLKLFNDNINYFLTPTQLQSKLQTFIYDNLQELQESHNVNNDTKNKMSSYSNDHSCDDAYTLITKKQFRIGGVIHDLKYDIQNEFFKFQIIDEQTTINVHYKGALPNLFGEGQTAIILGKFILNKQLVQPLPQQEITFITEDKNKDKSITLYSNTDICNKAHINTITTNIVECANLTNYIFIAKDILAKHDQNYRPLGKNRQK